MKLLLALLSGLLLAVSGISHAAGDVDAGKTKSSKCTSCHGSKGKGGGAIPAIAGLDSAMFISAVNEYKNGKRRFPMMESVARKLSEQEIADLAAYYSALPK